MVRNLLFSMALAGSASSLAAAPLSVRVVDGSGRPIRDAVVSLYPSGSAGRPAHAGGHFVVSQKDLQFHPFLTIVPVGADVSFPNLDPTKHHVYSFSQAKKFELKLFAKDQSRTVHFDKPGVVKVFCQIHSHMSATVMVFDHPWFTVPDEGGTFELSNLPTGTHQITAWHERLGDTTMDLRVEPGRTETIDFVLPVPAQQ